VGDVAGEVLRRRETSPRPRTVTCGWCGKSVQVPSRGRIPTWCGSVCRHRAWEQAQAASSGLSAKEVVERVVERTVTLTVRAPRPEPREARPAPRAPSRADEWVHLLTELTKQLDGGRVYTRDLSTVARAVDGVQQALARRERLR